MKTRHVAITILVCMISLCISIVHAQESLACGYRITTDHHGIDVFVGETVIAWADTTNLTTYTVNFTWIFEDSEIRRTVNVTEYITWYTGVGGWPKEPGLPNGTEVRRFTDSYGPFETGDMGEWAVKARFINTYGQTWASDHDSFPVKATSFNVIPDVPVVGTAGAVTAMLLGLGFYWHKKKNQY